MFFFNKQLFFCVYFFNDRLNRVYNRLNTIYCVITPCEPEAGEMPPRQTAPVFASAPPVQVFFCNFAASKNKTFP